MKQRNQKFRKKKKKISKKKKKKFQKKKTHSQVERYAAGQFTIRRLIVHQDHVCKYAFLPPFFFFFIAPLALFMFHEQCIKTKIQSPFGNLIQHIFFTFQTHLYTFQHTFSPTHILKISKIPYSNLTTKRVHNIFSREQ